MSSTPSTPLGGRGTDLYPVSLDPAVPCRHSPATTEPQRNRPRRASRQDHVVGASNNAHSRMTCAVTLHARTIVTRIETGDLISYQNDGKGFAAMVDKV